MRGTGEVVAVAGAALEAVLQAEAGEDEHFEAHVAEHGGGGRCLAPAAARVVLFVCVVVQPCAVLGGLPGKQLELMPIVS